MTTLDRLLITINIWKKRKSASDTLLIFTAIFSIKKFLSKQQTLLYNRQTKLL